jgi:hypothetical protein
MNEFRIGKEKVKPMMIINNLLYDCFVEKASHVSVDILGIFKGSLK